MMRTNPIRPNIRIGYFSEGANLLLSPLRGRGRDAVYFTDRETRRSRYQDASLLGGIRLLGRLRNGMADS